MKIQGVNDFKIFYLINSFLLFVPPLLVLAIGGVKNN